MKHNLTIKQYYFKHFKNEFPSSNMKDDTTFNGLLETIENHENVDTYLFTEKPNELITKRVIAVLCDMYGLEWEYLLNLLKRCKR